MEKNRLGAVGFQGYRLSGVSAAGRSNANRTQLGSHSHGNLCYGMPVAKVWVKSRAAGQAGSEL